MNVENLTLQLSYSCPKNYFMVEIMLKNNMNQLQTIFFCLFSKYHQHHHWSVGV